MNLIQSILTKNPCYTCGRTITPKGLMLHSVGCPQPSAAVFVKNWNSPSYDRACVHAFIDGNTGDVHQTLPWNRRGWHCGAAANNTHIGVETYNSAVELFAMLCKEFNLDPLADGVIISHKEGCARGIASNHGDPEHLWNQLGTGYTMDGFRKAVKAAMSGATVEGYTSIAGTAKATVGQMTAYIKAKNPAVPASVLNMIPLYLTEGAAEGIRGDVAFAQSCLETGNFGFAGSAVTLDQNNFCGMGVTSNGVKGNSFDSPQMGIRAQIQHLKAYANTEALNGACIDPRFQYVTRGCAEYVEWLGQQENPNGKGWATGAGYGEKILSILKAILATDSDEEMEEAPVARYNKISDMPSYAQPTIIKMVDGGFIGGCGTGAKDENNRPADLDLSMDMIRVFVTNDRAGLYDKT